MNKYEIIQKYCKLRGTNVSQMERDLGFARGSIAKIDEHTPSSEKIRKICAYLNMPINYLIDIDGALHEITAEINGRTVSVFPEQKKSDPNPKKSRNEIFMEKYYGKDREKQNESTDSYYVNTQAAEMAKEIFKRDEMRVLFDAVRDVPKEDIEVVIRMIEGLKK